MHIPMTRRELGGLVIGAPLAAPFPLMKTMPSLTSAATCICIAACADDAAMNINATANDALWIFFISSLLHDRQIADCARDRDARLAYWRDGHSGLCAIQRISDQRRSFDQAGFPSSGDERLCSVNFPVCRRP